MLICCNNNQPERKQHCKDNIQNLKTVDVHPVCRSSPQTVCMRPSVCRSLQTRMEFGVRRLVSLSRTVEQFKISSAVWSCPFSSTDKLTTQRGFNTTKCLSLFPSLHYVTLLPLYIQTYRQAGRQTLTN